MGNVDLSRTIWILSLYYLLFQCWVLLLPYVAKTRIICCSFIAKSLSHVQFFSTPWTVARQAFPCMEFPRQKYWSRLSFSSPEDLPDPGIEPESPALADRFFTADLPGSINAYSIFLSF